MDECLYDMSKGWNSLAAECLYAEMQNCSAAELDFYDRRIRQNGEVALDQACGTGRHLFALIDRGLEVHGADISGDALGFAKKEAAKRGICPVLYHQRMEECDIPHRYGTIYVANGTFQIIAERQQALSTLRRFWQHLTPGGQLLLELFVPEAVTKGLNTNDEEYPIRWESVRRDAEGEIVTTLWCESVDLSAKTLVSRRQLELLIEGECVKTETHSHLMTWFLGDEIVATFEQSGFVDIRTYSDYTDQPATKESKTIVYGARRPLE